MTLVGTIRPDDAVAIEKFVARAQEAVNRRGPDGAHGVAHIRRVVGLAYWIAENIPESVDRTILHAACWLHDLRPLEKDDPARSSAARRSGSFAAEFLIARGWSNDQVESVADAVASHSFSSCGTPSQIEGTVLRDADRLDALGAIGLARMFYIAGRMGSELYHAVDPFADDRALDDRRYALDHCQVKLQKLVDGVMTSPAKEAAAERWSVIEHYLNELRAEIQPSIGL